MIDNQPIQPFALPYWRLKVHFLLVFLLLLSADLQAAIYRCQQAGMVSFQEKPCTKGPSEVVEVQDYKIGTSPLPDLDLFKERKQDNPRTKPNKAPANKGTDKRCFSKQQQLDKIRWQMSRGYKASAGEKLRQRRRQLEAYRREFCR